MSAQQITAGTTVIDSHFANLYGADKASRMTVIAVAGDELVVEVDDCGTVVRDTVWADEVQAVNA